MEESPDIQVSHRGKHPINWDPSSPEPPVDRYAHVRERLRRILLNAVNTLPKGDPIGRITKRSGAVALLVIANDPSSILGQVASEQQSVRMLLCFMVGCLPDFFGNGYLPLASGTGEGSSAAGPDQSANGPTSSQPTAADRRAQSQVPGWYGEKCVLSGLSEPHGAHIVPVPVLGGDCTKEMWECLEMFWKLPKLDEIEKEATEMTNLLPMSPDPHAFWDRYRFALRPILHPHEPRNRLYLQMVWLGDSTEKGRPESGHQDTKSRRIVTDYRRGHDGMHPAIEHGDVYELWTQDPETRPLPSVKMLEIQFAAHKILAGLTAAGSLRNIFDEDPPEDCGAAYDLLEVPPLWRLLIKEAQEQAILTARTAQLWTRAFARQEEQSWLPLWRQYPSGDEDEG